MKYKIFIIIVLVFNFLILWKYINQRGIINILYTQIDKQSKNDDWKQKLFLNYQIGYKKLNDSLILTDKTGNTFRNVIKDNFSIILFFPKNICDLCEKELFSVYKSASYEKGINVIALVPVESYRDFLNYNIDYQLGINFIFPYKNSLIDRHDLLSNRGFFLLVNPNLEISNIYIPDNPIVKSDLLSYFDIIKSKKFIINTNE